MSNLRNHLVELVEANLSGSPVGLTSVCSSHPMIIEAAMEHNKTENSLLLIESTSNQVDQFGGYSGMKPKDFQLYVENLADKVGFDRNNLILGGDHLGPNRWRNMPAKQAMEFAHELIKAYVQAGYHKIHLDASMPLMDDVYNGVHSVSEELVAERTAQLCKTSEKTFASLGKSKKEAPVYIIGSEVPIPGGETDSNNSEVIATTPEKVKHTIDMTRKAFIRLGMDDVWTRVIGLVVQPKIDFSNEWICYPDLKPIFRLKDSLEAVGERICYEAHSTDYQSEETLRILVENHFAFLKVGPALSFALRESLYSLEQIEKNLFHSTTGMVLSELQGTIEQEMNNNPQYWRDYCPDSPLQYSLKHFGLSDRTRYYLGKKRVDSSISTLMSNLKGKNVPIGLVSQFLPGQLGMIEQKVLNFQQPEKIVRHAIQQVLGIYHRASLKSVGFQH